MDRLNAMLVFSHVVEARGFSEAARRLGLSKSQVSKQVTALEERLGAQLLQRTTRRLSLTEAGRAFYEHCSRILRDVEEAERAASRARADLQGVLRVNAPMSFGQLALAPLLAAFLTRHPELRVDLVLDDRSVDAIEGGFDVTVRIARRLADSSLVARRLCPARVQVYGAPDYLAGRGTPRSLEDLSTHDCLVYAFHQPWQFRVANGKRSLAVSGPLIANNGDALREAAVAGLGLVQLPRFIVAAALARGQLRPVLERFEERGAAIWALYSPTRHPSAKVRVFVDFLVAHFADAERRASAEGAASKSDGKGPSPS